MKPVKPTVFREVLLRIQFCVDGADARRAVAFGRHKLLFSSSDAKSLFVSCMVRTSNMLAA